jgi:DNA-binding FadR family transcriptional regulator
MAAIPLSFRPTWQELKQIRRAQSELGCSATALFRLSLRDTLTRLEREGLVSAGHGKDLPQPSRCA